jgi:hypothetical protein
MALERQARRSVDPRKYEKWTPRSQVRKSAIDDRLDVTLPALSFLERR